MSHARNRGSIAKVTYTLSVINILVYILIRCRININEYVYDIQYIYIVHNFQS